jgi:squalene-hopene/tetraprenyl-beta-curcumene cyclase
MIASLGNQYTNLVNLLIQEKNSEGFWTGQLSSSALSTAVAIVALKINRNQDDEEQIKLGYNWLCTHINTDGGFGDTPESESNVSTSLLCYAAIFYCQPNMVDGNPVLKAIENFLETKKISLNEHNITSSILQFYGTDYTFSVPILSMLILCGVLPDEASNRIPQLPFELSLLPESWYRFFNLQVVSYAIPALIGVGIFIHTKRKSKVKFYRNRFVAPAIKKLTAIMPESGGFLEAIPLTGFVSMCLIASGKGNNEVVKNGISFLQKQQRTDGSWPIDTDLSTWVTTLSIKALGPQLNSVIGKDNIQQLKAHLHSIQYKTIHPFNGAKPGGWGWTNYSGSVPDADDTPGAILALLEMYEGTREEIGAIVNGCNWLVDLQNSDGGFPTFCKGWGRLPFDSSCADLTGHALLALFSSIEKSGNNIPFHLHRKFYRSALKAADFLQKHQATDGYWLPLWFGNQFTDDKKNPVYGTAKVCSYMEDCLLNSCVHGEIKERLMTMIESSQNFLLIQQNHDGSWGGKKGTTGSIEETALAICALAKSHKEPCIKGFEWLANEHESNGLQPSAIGLYFAALWYHEKMYPLIYYVEALRRFLNTGNSLLENLED